MEDERGDVISLVDSEDEVFQVAVPRLPPPNQTVHVQVHPVPADDAEEADCPGPSPQPQDNIGEFEDPLQLIKF
ncbi:hypothetical protein CRUP_026583 [Coryphaenoides rupestris]|nr:hypothetical protein CRUP_026583 [Coryphaenoides rupestris]